MILDAYDSDCDELNSAKIVSCESFQEWLRCITETETDINRDSNIIPYSQYPSETQTEYCTRIHNSSAQQDVLILSMFEQLNTQVMHCTNVNLEYKSANKALTTKLDRYKEEVKDLKENQNLFELSELRAQSQAKDTVIVKLKEQIKSLKGNVDDSKVKMDMDEIETLNIELEHREIGLVRGLTKLILKRSYILHVIRRKFKGNLQTQSEDTIKEKLYLLLRIMWGQCVASAMKEVTSSFSVDDDSRFNAIAKLLYKIVHRYVVVTILPCVEEVQMDEDKEGKAIDPSHYHGMIGTLLYLTASWSTLGHARLVITCITTILPISISAKDFYNWNERCEATFESAYAEKGSIEKPLERKRLLEELGKDSIEHAEFDESNTNVLERFYTSAGNPVKEILLKLNLPDHRILKDGGEVKEFQRSFCHSDIERLSRSDEVLKLKNLKKDALLKLFKFTYQERYEHVGPEVTSSQDGKVYKMAKRDYAWLMISRCSRSHFHIQVNITEQAQTLLGIIFELIRQNKNETRRT
ncbi:hypothetical protein Tco_0797932 [Tanacetum coccineum]